MLKKMESDDLTDKSIEAVRGPRILNWAAIMLTTVPQVSSAIILQKLGNRKKRRWKQNWRNLFTEAGVWVP